MKISRVESGKASVSSTGSEARILPSDRPKGSVSTKQQAARRLSPLEHGMAVAESALNEVADTREDIVKELKQRIESGEYKIDGKEVADMMLRRLEADRIR